MGRIQSVLARYYASINLGDAVFMPENLSQGDSHPSNPTPSSRGTAWVIGQGVLFLLFFISVLAGGAAPDIPGIVFAQVVGVLVAVGGAVLSGWSAIYHGWALSPFPKPNDGQQLIDQGPYRYVRHPMYSGIIAFTLGVGLAYANPVTLLSSLAFTVFFMAKSGHEEDLLVAEIPGYRQYRSAVPWRLIPFLL
jgi:protein-S-isoprenylcysteine O-methyltransferase Ste14